MKKRVYLGGAINGCTDEEANGWRDGFIADHPEFECVNPMERDYRGREDECVNEIVELDKQDIDTSDVCLFYCIKPSWGTGMEIYHSWKGGVLNVLVISAGTIISPWQRYHSNAIVPTLDEAAATLHDWFDLA